MLKKYRVKLADEERAQLRSIVRQGKAAAHKQRHARILLKADEENSRGGLTDKEITAEAEVGIATVERVRQLFVEHGLDAALERKDPERHYLRRLDGEAEARLVALACSEPPEGQARWTLRLLADRLVELEVVPSVSHEAVRMTLKKTNLSLG